MSRAERVWQKTQGLDALVICSPQNRYYLSGFTGSAGCVFIDGTHRYLLTDSRYVLQARQEAPDFEIIETRKPFDSIVHLAREHEYKHIGIEARHTTVKTYDEIQQRFSDIKWVPATDLVELERRVKDETELMSLKQAARIADEALASVVSQIRPGITEQELAIALETAMRQKGSEGLSFPTIVASGPRGALPHAKPSERQLQADEWVTIDFGAVYRGYHSDETVTIPVTNQARSRQLQAIYDIVYQAQKAGIAVVKPGILASEVDEVVRRVIIEAGFGEYFGHGTGHGVGLDVHEDPFLGPKPEHDMVLEAGMVITVEPGIYLPDMGGVRLEDMLVVTKEGSIRLTSWDKRLN
ncbi:M24 family metallopeptidase [Sulfobacillus thermosulfidooxidans]|uniref:M24 family metallopeptidase n=1 Tax=Sulfobacillus thermosulfidooxidans TaxID=28034 RepID=UPI00096BCA0B|nr:aminopeptidase P family protein [Sulfobacillus thermosulfidooxidans]OLZ08552.1 hypothetical protein BFX05_03210 [Sulfobacillus thermosulfidooxidans]OLZ13154.1 hypothetical protein BFX06_11460 [Sulfobacillus thermosulfidooxidans]OLZ21534.1 hypothetical protein BFX07_11885 [Sulfobacillus thermosulfidooxidans]